MIFHVSTKEDAILLLNYLEEKGYFWCPGCRPTQYNPWNVYKEKTCIKTINNRIIYGSYDVCNKKNVVEFTRECLIYHLAIGGFTCT